jgi:TetR/AcrR family transcriptional regulator, transcriptional repressor of bet genes
MPGDSERNRPRKRERTRAQIVMAAVGVIAARGVDATRLIDVARAAGVSVGNVQYYFDTREDLLAATFEAANDASIADWEAISSSDRDAPSRVSAMLRMAAFGRPGWEDIGWTIWVEFWAVSHRNDRFREQYDVIYRKWRETIVSAFTDGVQRGEFKPRDLVQDTVDRLAALIEGLAIRTILGPADMPPTRMFELLITAAERELGCVLPK